MSTDRPFNLADAAKYGLYGGIAAVLIALVGMVEAFSKREIIADKLSRLESLWGPQKLNISNMEELPWYVQQHQQELRHMIYKP